MRLILKKSVKKGALGRRFQVETKLEFTDEEDKLVRECGLDGLVYKGGEDEAVLKIKNLVNGLSYKLKSLGEAASCIQMLREACEWLHDNIEFARTFVDSTHEWP